MAGSSSPWNLVSLKKSSNHVRIFAMNKHPPPATLIWLLTSREHSLASRTRFLAVAWDQSPPWSVLLFIVKHSFFILIPEHLFVSQKYVGQQGVLPTAIQRKWMWPAIAFHIWNVFFWRKEKVSGHAFGWVYFLSSAFVKTVFGCVKGSVALLVFYIGYVHQVL